MWATASVSWAAVGVGRVYDGDVMRGSHELWYFWRVLVWLKRKCSPSQSNQHGVCLSSPFEPDGGYIWARAVESNRS